MKKNKHKNNGILFFLLFFYLLSGWTIILTNGDTASENNTTSLYVNGLYGSDNNNSTCTENYPCKSISYAISISFDGFTIYISNNTIYQCKTDNTGFVVNKLLYFIGFNTTIDCDHKYRGFTYYSVPVYITGFNIINGYTDDFIGGSAILFIKSNFTNNIADASEIDSIYRYNHIIENNSFENHVNEIGSAVHFHYEDNAEYITHFIKYCRFLNNRVSGAMNIRYFGSSNQNNNISVINTEFLMNTHTSISVPSDYQDTAAGAVNIVYSGFKYKGNQFNSFNHHSFHNCTFRGNIQSNIVDINNTDVNSIEAGSGAVNIFTRGDSEVSIDNSVFEFINSIFDSNIGGSNLSSGVIGDSIGSENIAFGASAVGINSFSSNFNEHSMNQYKFINNEFVSNYGGENNASPIIRLSLTDLGCIAAAGTLVIADIAIEQTITTSHITYLFNSTNFINNTGGNNNISPIIDLIFNPYGFYSASLTSGGIVIAAVSREIHQSVEELSILAQDCLFSKNSGGNSNNIFRTSDLSKSAVSMSSGAFTIGYINLGISNSVDLGLSGYAMNLYLINSEFMNNAGGNYNSYITTDSIGKQSLTAFASAAFLFGRFSEDDLIISDENFIIEKCVFHQNSGGNHNIGAVGVIDLSIPTIGLTSSALLLATVTLGRSQTQSSMYNIISTSIQHNTGASFNTKIGKADDATQITASSSVNLVTVANYVNSHDILFSIDGCDFIDNTLIGSNGLVSLYSSSSAALHIGLASSNSNRFSDIVYRIQKSQFLHNSARLDSESYWNMISGAVAITSTSNNQQVTNLKWYIEDCIFFGNKIPNLLQVTNFKEHSNLVGGLLIGLLGTYDGVGTVGNILNCEFSHNHGGVRIDTLDYRTSASVLISHSNFTENDATLGAGIIVLNTKLAISNCRFDNNVAALMGGAIYVSSDSFTLSSSLLIDNAALAGSAIFNNDKSVTISDSIIYMDIPATADSTETISLSSIVISLTNGSTVICPAGSEVIFPGSGYGCRLCGNALYNTGNSSQTDDEAVQGQCLPCPFAALCSGSTVQASKGFWGAKNNSDGSIALTYCPTGYCCNLDYCSSYYICAGNRAGILCGECSLGYTESVSSTSCVEITDECSANLAWFIIVCFVLGTCVSVYFLSRSKHNSGFINITVYFYQGAGLILLQQQSNTTAALQSILFDLFSFQVGVSGGSEICISSTLTAVNKQVFYVVSALFIIIPLCLLILIVKYLFTRRRLHRGIVHSISQRIEHNSAIIHSLLRVCLFMYSSIVLRVSNLLHCITIRNIDTRRLFRAANIECYQPWQQFLFVLLSVTLLIPLILLLWGYKAKYNTDSINSNENNNNNNNNNNTATKSTFQVIYMLLSSPYKPEYGYWESVLLIWRLYSVLVATFVSLPTSVLLYLFLGNFIILVLHVHYQPFKDSVAQFYETLCLTGLMVMCPLGLSLAALTSNASSASDRPIEQDINICKIFQVIILFIPVITLSIIAIQYIGKSLKNRNNNRYSINNNINNDNNNNNNNNSQNHVSLLDSNEDLALNHAVIDNNNDHNSSNSNSFIVSDSYTELKD